MHSTTISSYNYMMNNLRTFVRAYNVTRDANGPLNYRFFYRIAMHIICLCLVYGRLKIHFHGKLYY